MIQRLFFVFVIGLLMVNAQLPKKFHYAIFAPPAYTVDKNMDLILALTAEQDTRVLEAYTAMREDPEVQRTNEQFKAAGTQKDEAALAAKKAFYEAKAAAEKKYQDAVSEILSPEQKSLVDAVNTWASQLSKETLKGEGGWNEKMAQLHAAGQSRLSEVLTAEQIAMLGAASAPVASPTP